MPWSRAIAVSCAGVLAGAVTLLSGGGSGFVFEDAGQRVDPLPASSLMEPLVAASPARVSMERQPPALADRPNTGAAVAEALRTTLEGLAIAAESPGSDATSLLAEAALGHPDIAVREEAVHALGERGDGLAVQTLQQSIQDPDARVRAASVRALTAIGTEDAVRVLGGTLSATDASLRLDAADALGEIGSRAAGRFLQQLLGDDDPRIRDSAEAWLEELGSANGR